MRDNVRGAIILRWGYTFIYDSNTETTGYLPPNFPNRKSEVTLCSMNDPNLYGEELHVITFSEDLELDLLTDYKVIFLTIDEGHISSRLQNLVRD